MPPIKNFERVYVVDGNKDEEHPALDLRQQKQDGQGHFLRKIKWEFAGYDEWVIESRIRQHTHSDRPRRRNRPTLLHENENRSEEEVKKRPARSPHPTVRRNQLPPSGRASVSPGALLFHANKGPPQPTRGKRKLQKSKAKKRGPKECAKRKPPSKATDNTRCVHLARVGSAAPRDESDPEIKDGPQSVSGRKVHPIARRRIGVKPSSKDESLEPLRRRGSSSRVLSTKRKHVSRKSKSNVVIFKEDPPLEVSSAEDDASDPEFVPRSRQRVAVSADDQPIIRPNRTVANQTRHGYHATQTAQPIDLCSSFEDEPFTQFDQNVEDASYEHDSNSDCGVSIFTQAPEITNHMACNNESVAKAKDRSRDQAEQTGNEDYSDARKETSGLPCHVVGSTCAMSSTRARERGHLNSSEAEWKPSSAIVGEVFYFGTQKTIASSNKRSRIATNFFSPAQFSAQVNPKKRVEKLVEVPNRKVRKRKKPLQTVCRAPRWNRHNFENVKCFSEAWS